MIRTGGLGEVFEKDDEIVEIVNGIKKSLEEKTEQKIISIEPISYKRQVVAGMNYFVKVSCTSRSMWISHELAEILIIHYHSLTWLQAKLKLGDGSEKFAHLRIYRNLKKNLELTAHKMDTDEQAELEYFWLSRWTIVNYTQMMDSNQLATLTCVHWPSHQKYRS